MSEKCSCIACDAKADYGRLAAENERLKARLKELFGLFSHCNIYAKPCGVCLTCKIQAQWAAEDAGR